MFPSISREVKEISQLFCTKQTSNGSWKQSFRRPTANGLPFKLSPYAKPFVPVHARSDPDQAWKVQSNLANATKFR